MGPRPCQSARPCARPARPGERFCWHHREEALRHLDRAGYLQAIPRPRPSVSPRERRARARTGDDDNMGLDNAVRALEG